MTVSPDTGGSKYAGDGTIDLSFLSGGGSSISPSKVDSYLGSPGGHCANLSHAMEEDYCMDEQLNCLIKIDMGMSDSMFKCSSRESTYNVSHG